MGFVLSGMNLGALVAPFIAGALYENVGYYAVFAVVIGVLIFDTFLRLIMIEKRTAMQWLEIESCDPVSNEEAHLPRDIFHNYHDVTESSSCSSSTITADEPQYPPILPSDESSPLLSKEPPSSSAAKNSWFHRTFPAMSVLLSSPRLMTAVYGCFTHTTFIAAFDAILPLFVKRSFGWGSTGAGFIFLAITIPSLLGPVVGALSDRHGTKRVALVGFAIAGPFLALLGLVRGSSVVYQILLVVLLVLTSK